MPEAADISPGWDTGTGRGSKLTAATAAARLFRGGGFDGNLFTLTGDKAVRLPGASRTRSLLDKGTALDAPTVLRVRSEGRGYRVLLWEGTRPEGSQGEGGFADKVAVLAVFPVGSAEPTDVPEVKTGEFTFRGEKLLSLGIAGGMPGSLVARPHCLGRTRLGAVLNRPLALAGPSAGRAPGGCARSLPHCP